MGSFDLERASPEELVEVTEKNGVDLKDYEILYSAIQVTVKGL